MLLGLVAAGSTHRRVKQRSGQEAPPGAAAEAEA
jgi:hypothetical protein